MKRWYEKHTVLSRNIELMRDMTDQQRDHLALGIMRIIKEQNPTLLDDFVENFPMEIHRKRWYDQDPYLWLIINGLEYAKNDLISNVECYLEIESAKFPDESGENQPVS